MSYPFASRAETRIGFHYFNDTVHYREADLHAWLPEIKGLGGSWLTLIAPPDRAIPETFLRGLIEERIEPVLHFHLPLDRPADLDSLALLLHSYASWGVQYITLYDRPNSRAPWPAASWTQSDLVERFLDLYIPAASLVVKSGMVPVFPPLEPGGNYWDTAFLRVALQSILRRGQVELADKITLGAYAWAKEGSIAWGAGGPERWPQARPYFTPEGQEDQRGFYIFDWYLAIAEAALGRPCPIILLASGPDAPEPPLDEHTRINLEIARLMLGTQPPGKNLLPPVSPHILACNFWLLCSAETSKDAGLAWFHEDRRALPVVQALTRLRNGREDREAPSSVFGSAEPHISFRPLRHYILLPKDLEQVDLSSAFLQSLIAEQHPTIGFSLDEAALAEQVSVVGDEAAFPDALLGSLRTTGCSVKRLNIDGTSIAPNG